MMKNINIQNKEISIIIPAYSESNSINELIARIEYSLSTVVAEGDYEVIIIDDGSTDGTDLLLAELQIKKSYLKVISFRRNCGKSLALMAGFNIAQGKIVLTMDADLQDRPEDIYLFLDAIKNPKTDLVSGWRVFRTESPIRRVGSKLYNLCIYLLTGLKIHDSNSGFKAYKLDVIKRLVVYGQYHRFLPLMAYFMGFNIAEIRIANDGRKFGISKYRTFRYEGLFDLISIVFLYKYALNPLYFFGPISFSLLIPSFLVICYLVVEHLIFLVSENSGSLLLSRPLFIGALFIFTISILIFLTGLMCNLILHFSIKNNMNDIINRIKIN